MKLSDATVLGTRSSGSPPSLTSLILAPKSSPHQILDPAPGSDGAVVSSREIPVPPPVGASKTRHEVGARFPNSPSMQQWVSWRNATWSPNKGTSVPQSQAQLHSFLWAQGPRDASLETLSRGWTGSLLLPSTGTKRLRVNPLEEKEQ